METCKDSATAYDGSWIWDTQPKLAACVDYRPVKALQAAGVNRVSTPQQQQQRKRQSKCGQPCCWPQSTPLLKQLQQQAPAMPTRSHGSSPAATHKQQHKRRGSSTAAARKRSSGASQPPPDPAALTAAITQLRDVSADGLPSWTADIEWFDDPFVVVGLQRPGYDLHNNLVCSTISVQVVSAELTG